MVLRNWNESALRVGASVIGATDVTLIFDFLIGADEKALVG